MDPQQIIETTPTSPLMTPMRVEETKEQLKRLKDMASAPPYIRNAVQDMKEVRRQIRGHEDLLNREEPKPFDPSEIDAACKAHEILERDVAEGMPSSEEMRRMPPGALDKYRVWQSEKKDLALKLKNLKRRLHVSGVLDSKLPDATDVANLEKLRPRSRLSMDNAVIPITKTVHLPPANAGPVAVMTDADSDKLKALDPELHAQMATLSNDMRAKVLALVRGEVEVKPRRRKRTMSPEAREKARQKMREIHARRRAEKEQANDGHGSDPSPPVEREQEGHSDHE